MKFIHQVVITFFSYQIIQASFLNSIQLKAGCRDFWYIKGSEEKVLYYNYLIDKSDKLMNPNFLERKSVSCTLSLSRLHIMGQLFFLGGRPSYRTLGARLDLLKYCWLQIGIGLHAGKVALNEIINLGESKPFKEMYNLGVESCKDAVKPYLKPESFNLKNNLCDIYSIAKGASIGALFYIRAIPGKIKNRFNKPKRKSVALKTRLKNIISKEYERSSAVKDLVKDQFLMHLEEDNQSVYLFSSEIYCKFQSRILQVSISRGVDFFTDDDVISRVMNFSEGESTTLDEDVLSFLTLKLIPCFLSTKSLAVDISFLPFLFL